MSSFPSRREFSVEVLQHPAGPLALEVQQLLPEDTVRLVEVLPASGRIDVEVFTGVFGLPGPPGPPGPVGPAPTPAVFTQVSPLTSWVFAHNLGREPIIQLTTLGGVVLLGDITNISNNVVQVDFDAPVSGKILAF